MRLKGKAAIITGVSFPGQAGFALAQAFAREGADLVISARSEERINARAQELRDSGVPIVLPVAADLTTEEGAKTLIDDTKRVNDEPKRLTNPIKLGTNTISL